MHIREAGHDWLMIEWSLVLRDDSNALIIRSNDCGKNNDEWGEQCSMHSEDITVSHVYEGCYSLVSELGFEFVSILL